LIIAEVGQNFGGDIESALNLIDLAQENGGDLCKFQLYDHNILYSDHPDIPDVALSFEQAKTLFDYGQNVGIEVFFSVFDVERVGWCEEIGVKRYKVATLRKSVDVIRAVSATGKPVIVSHGYGHHFWWGIIKEELPNARHLICLPEYPASPSKLGLKGIAFVDTTQRTTAFFPVDGFSDHTIGLDVAKIALARGASIIEKHFAWDHHTGIDAPWSMDAKELRELKQFENVVKEAL